MEMIFFDQSELGEGHLSRPETERVVKGDPRFTTWTITSSEDKQISSGVWEATPGAWISMKEGVWEFCTIVSGTSVITEEGKAPRTLRTGDTVVLRPDFRGIWEVIETTRKIWVTRAPK